LANLAAGEFDPARDQAHFVGRTICVFGLEAPTLLFEMLDEVGLHLFDLNFALHTGVGTVRIFRDEELVGAEEHAATRCLFALFRS